MTRRIIIDYPEGLDPESAVGFVTDVIRAGRISECSTGKHYCWVTDFRFFKIRVITRQLRDRSQIRLSWRGFRERY